jgi:hypothetical protein
MVSAQSSGGTGRDILSIRCNWVDGGFSDNSCLDEEQPYAVQFCDSGYEHKDDVCEPAFR